MTLNKNTQMILGVGAVAIVGYLLWKRQSASTVVAAPASTSFAGPVGRRGKFNATGTSKIAIPKLDTASGPLQIIDKCAKCQSNNGTAIKTTVNGVDFYSCCQIGVVAINGCSSVGCLS